MTAGIVRRMPPPKVAYLVATGFFLKLACSFSLILSCASFLKTAGADQLSNYYIILNILSLTVGSTLAVRNIKDFDAPIRWSAVVGLYVLYYSYIASPSKAEAIIFYTVISLYDIYANILFWTCVNQRLTILEVKRHVGLISGMSVLGGITIGVASKFLLAGFSLKAAYGLCAAIHIALPAITIFSAARDRAAPEGPERQPKRLADLFDTGVTSSGLFRTIAAIFIFSSFMRYILGFRYGAAVSEIFRDESQIAGFVGIFESAVKAALFLAQVFAAKNLLRSFTLRQNLAFYQAGLFGFSIAAAVTGSPLVVIAFQFYFQVFVKLIEQNAANVMFNVFPDGLKNRLKFVVEGTIFPVTSIFVALLISALKASAQPSVFFAILAAVSAAYFISTIRLNDSYLGTVAATLGSGRGESRPAAAIGYGEGFDPAVFVDSGREGRIEMARRMCAGGGFDARFVSRLLAAERDPFVIATLVKAAAATGSREMLREAAVISSGSDDFRVTANFIEACAMTGCSNGVQFIIPYLGHHDNRVRANAILAAVRMSSDRATLETAVNSLADMTISRSARHRASAAAAMGEIGLVCFAPAVMKLMSDGDRAVRGAAAAAAERIGSPSFIAHIRRMMDSCDDPDMAERLGRAAERIGRDAAGRLNMAVNRLPDDLKARFTALSSGCRDAAALELMTVAVRAFPPGTALAVAEALATDADAGVRRAIESALAVEPAGMSSIVREAVSTGLSKEWCRKFFASAVAEARKNAAMALADAVADDALDATAITGFFRALGYFIDSSASAEDIMAGLASDDPVKSDLAMELIEGVEDAELKKAASRLGVKLKKNRAVI